MPDPSPFTIPDDGYQEFGIAGVEKRVDIYEAWNRVVEATRASEGRPAHEWHKALVGVLLDLGFPEVSTRVAVRFYDALAGVMAALKKADAPTPGSPGSTASEPSPCPPGPSSDCSPTSTG